MKKFLLLSLSTLAFIGLTAQSYKPGIKMKKGQQYEIVSTVTGSMQMGMEVPIESKLESVVVVKDETAQGYTVTSLNKHFVFKTNMMGQEANYDSDKKEDADGQMGPLFKDVAGRRDSFMVDHKGYTRNASPEKPSPKKDDKKKDMMGMMMNSVVGTNAAGVPIFNVLPPVTELKVGESIVDSAQNNADGKEKIVTTYTVTEIKDGKIKISINTVANIEKKMDTELMGMTTSVVMTSVNTGKGEMLLDQATGMLLNKTVTTETEGNASFNGMALPVTGTSTAVTTVKVL